VTAAAYGTAAQENENPVNPGNHVHPVEKDFQPSQTFRYDHVGNRLEVTDNGMTLKYQPNEANQYTRIEVSESVPSAESVVVKPQFDPLGNLLHDDRNTYTWDADIHLLSVTTKASEKGQVKSQKGQATGTEPSAPAPTAQFRYDALHRRVARLENNTQLTLFVMDGWNVIQEHTLLTNQKSEIVNQKSPTARHTWGEDLSGTLQGAGGIGGLLSTTHHLSATQNPTQSTTHWFHYDSNGNAILLTDAKGKESALYRYDSFGRTIIAQGSAALLNRYRFSTKPVESVSGLAYYGYRYYSPNLGR
jgi:hypothetical protein